MDIVQLLSNDIFIQIMIEYSLSPGGVFLAAEYKNEGLLITVN